MTKEDKIISKLLQYMKNERSTWGIEAAQDIEYVNNVQYTEEEALAIELDNAPALAVNEMKPARDQVVDQLTKNPPRWISIPIENSDIKVAASMGDLMSWIWDQSKGNMHYRKAIEDFVDVGLFILMAYVDPYGDMGKGEVKLCRVDPFRVFIDPRCTYRNADDASDIFIVDFYSESRVKQDYPNFDLTKATESEADFKEYGTGAIRQAQVFNSGFLGDEKYYRIIDHYQKIKVDRIRVYDDRSTFERVMTEDEYQDFAGETAIILVKKGSESIVVEKGEVEKIMNMVRIYGRVFHYMSDGSIMSGSDQHGAEVKEDGTVIYPIQGTTVQVNVVRMFDLLQEGFLKYEIVKVDRIKRELLIGDKIHYDSVMPISKYPFAITMLHHTGNPYCYGDARLAKPMQELINKIHSIIVKYNINIANVKVFVPQGTNIKDLQERFGKAGAEFFEYDPSEGVPVFVQLQQMLSEFYAQLDRLKMHIQRIYGAYEFQDGLVGSPPQTKGGTLAIYEAGLNRAGAKLRLVEEALNDLGTVVGEMIPYVYDRRKIIRLIMPNNKPKEVIFNDQVKGDMESELKIINDLTVNKYDIKIITGSTLPSNRAMRHEAYMEMWREGVIRNPEPILRLTDLPDIEEVIKSEDRLKQAEQIINQLSEVIKNQKGDLQTSDRELKHADRLVEKEKFKSALKGIQKQLEAYLELGKARVNDNVKLKKDLSKGAPSLNGEKKTSKGRSKEN